MVELNDIIIKYIDSIYEVKGGITVHSNGAEVYYNEMYEHITNVFNLDTFIASGYLYEYFSDTELDYEIFVCKTRPLDSFSYVWAPYIPIQISHSPTVEETIAWLSAMTISSRYSRRFIGGVDAATLGGDMTVCTNIGAL
jgi:hypothetical protein